MTGANTSSPIVQAFSASGGTSNPTSVNYPSAFASPSNGGYAAWQSSVSTAPTPRAGWTNATNLNDPSFGRHQTVAYRASSDTAAGEDYGGLTNWDVIMLEIAAAGGGGGGGAHAGMYHHLRTLGAY